MYLLFHWHYLLKRNLAQMDSLFVYLHWQLFDKMVPIDCHQRFVLVVVMVRDQLTAVYSLVTMRLYRDQLVR